MRRTAILVFAMAAMLVSVLPAQAASPEDVAGEWTYIAVPVRLRQVDCTTFVSFTESDVWTGSLDGDSFGRGTGIFHCDGSADYHARLTFSELTFDNRTGEVVILATGRLAGPTAEWTGRWVVVSANGELAGLSGGGSFWGPGAGGFGIPGLLYYEGDVHF